MKKGHKSEGE